MEPVEVNIRGVIVFPAHVRLLIVFLIHAVLHNELWVKAKATQPRCGADLTRAVSLIAAPPLNTNVHLLSLYRLNRCLVSIQRLICGPFNPSFPFRLNFREQG